MGGRGMGIKRPPLSTFLVAHPGTGMLQGCSASKGSRLGHGSRAPCSPQCGSADSRLLGGEETPAKTRNIGLERVELSCAASVC